MAEVKIDISEYDSLRNRIKELEGLLSEEKKRRTDDSIRYENQIMELENGSRVIIKQPIQQLNIFNQEQFEKELDYMLYYSPYFYRNISSDLVKEIKALVRKHFYQSLGMNHSETFTYVNFNDVEKEVKEHFAEQIQESLKSEKEWKEWFNNKAKVLAELDIKQRDILLKEHNEIVEELSKKIKTLEYKLIPTEEKLTEVLDGLGLKAKKTLFGTILIKSK